MAGDLGVVLIAAAAIVGALIGSFLNVVIHRVPAGRSVVRPPSACPVCETRIRAIDNVPIVSWLILRGRCRSCSAPISARYPLVEFGTAVAFGAAAYWMLSPASPVIAVTTAAAGVGAVSAMLLVVAYLWLVGASIALTAIDLETHRLPNAIVLPGYAVAIIGLGVPAVIAGDLVRLGVMAAGAGILFTAYLVLWFAWPGGMGMGDVKLAGVLGAYLGFSGWLAFAVGAFAPFLLGGAVSLVLLLTRRATRKSGIPFGPWMIVGTWVGIVAGAPLASAYLALFGIAI